MLIIFIITIKINESNNFEMKSNKIGDNNYEFKLKLASLIILKWRLRKIKVNSYKFINNYLFIIIIKISESNNFKLKIMKNSSNNYKFK